ncbi:MAG: universal stress protein [Byssovorax sp.]
MRIEENGSAQKKSAPLARDEGWATTSFPPGPAPAARPLTMVVAVTLDMASAVALQRADVVARALGADLHILHVLPARPWLQELFSPRPANDDFEDPETSDATQRWCESMLAHALPSVRIHLRRGELSQCIRDLADELNAAIIVVGAPRSHRGKRYADRFSTHLVRQTRRSVLVARPPTSSNAIVAATDFSDQRFPALESARRLGAELHAPVTFIHTVVPMKPFQSSAPGASAIALDRLLGLALERRLDDMESLGAGPDRAVSAVVVAHDDVTQAILDVARARDADLVVVGAHLEWRISRLSFGGTADSVVASARRSVLMVPLQAEA